MTKEQLIDSLIIHCSYSIEESKAKLRSVLGPAFDEQEIFSVNLPALIAAYE